jgi:hypothetical protein
MPRKRNEKGFLWTALDGVVLFLQLFPIHIQIHTALNIFRKAKNVGSTLGFLQVCRSPNCRKTGLTGLRDSQMALRTQDCSIL